MLQLSIIQFRRFSALTALAILASISLYQPAFAQGDGKLKAGLNELTFSDGQFYCLYVPTDVLRKPQRVRILVAVHGYSGQKDSERGRRKVREAAERWERLAEKEDLVVLAPHFDEERFDRRYQRLNPGGLRADLRLHELIDEVEKALPGITTNKLLLFGFSGGGQFVHRYAMFHPDRVDRAVAGAAGWYTWPDSSLPYPVGTGRRKLPRGVEPKICELCGLDLLVLVGEKDINASAFRKEYGDYDLLELQGEGRVHRARNWVAAMREYAAEHNCDFKITLQTVPHTGHKVNMKLRNKAADFLAED